MISRLASVIAIGLLVLGCSSDHHYAAINPITDHAWSINDKQRFSFHIDDATSPYNVFVSIRNTGAYQYSNLWLFIQTEFPDHSLEVDTVECPLAYPDGRWLGEGVGDLLDNLILYQYQHEFPDSGNYTYTITHAMRANTIEEITDVGLIVDRATPVSQ